MTFFGFLTSVFAAIVMVVIFRSIWYFLNWLSEEDGLEKVKEKVSTMKDDIRVATVISLAAIFISTMSLLGRCQDNGTAPISAPTATATATPTPYRTVVGEMVRVVVPGEEEGQIEREYVCVQVWKGGDSQALIDCSTPTPSVPVTATIKLGQ